MSVKLSHVHCLWITGDGYMFERLSFVTYAELLQLVFKMNVSSFSRVSAVLLLLHGVKKVLRQQY